MAKGETYYRFSEDNTAPSIMICNIMDLKGFQRSRLRQGRWIDDWPEDVTAPTGFAATKRGHAPEALTDYVIAGTIDSALISERAMTALAHCKLNAAQFLPVKVVHYNTDVFLATYYAINPLHIVHGLNYQRTQWRGTSRSPGDPKASEGILKAVLDLDKVKGLDFFFLAVHDKINGKMLISKAVKHCLEAASATNGIKFRPVKAYEAT
jgi:hypothetical protein